MHWPLVHPLGSARPRLLVWYREAAFSDSADVAVSPRARLLPPWRCLNASESSPTNAATTRFLQSSRRPFASSINKYPRTCTPALFPLVDYHITYRGEICNQSMWYPSVISADSSFARKSTGHTKVWCIWHFYARHAIYAGIFSYVYQVLAVYRRMVKKTPIVVMYPRNTGVQNNLSGYSIPAIRYTAGHRGCSAPIPTRGISMTFSVFTKGSQTLYAIVTCRAACVPAFSPRAFSKEGPRRWTCLLTAQQPAACCRPGGYGAHICCIRWMSRHVPHEEVRGRGVQFWWR